MQSCHKFRCPFLIFWIHYLESGRYFYIKVFKKFKFYSCAPILSISLPDFNWHQMSGKAAKRDLFQCRLLSLSMKSHKNYVGTRFYPNLIYEFRTSAIMWEVRCTSSTLLAARLPSRSTRLS